MVKTSRYLVGLICASTLIATPVIAKNLDSDDEKVSYSIGVDIGQHFKKQDITVDMSSFSKGVVDGSTKNEFLLSDEEIKDHIIALQNAIVDKQNQERDNLAQQNLEQSKQFLDENKSKDGVQSTESGLQYTIIEEGQGTPPGINDFVTTHYQGTLIDGTKFDSSYDRGQPVEFPVSGVIPGWTEALQLMKPGSKWKLYIPPELAYGESGVGAMIGPNSTLIFDIELLEVDRKS